MQAEISTAKGLIVLNPSAGDGEPQAVLETIHEVLDGDRFDVYEMSEEEPLCAAIITRLDDGDYGWVAAVGGDGTVSLVANCLVGREVPLAIVPAGTGNALAQEFGIEEDIVAATRLLDNSPATRRIDALRVGEQHYFLQVGAGLEARTMQGTSSEQKSRWGSLAYFRTAVQELGEWTPQQFRLTIDGEQHELEAVELVLANSATVGVWDLSFGPRVVPDDGRIDVILFRAAGLTDYVDLLSSLLRNRQEESESIIYFPAVKQIEVASDEPLPIHGDGEVLDIEMPFTATVVPNALTLIVPPQY